MLHQVRTARLTTQLEMHTNPHLFSLQLVPPSLLHAPPKGHPRPAVFVFVCTSKYKEKEYQTGIVLVQG